MSDRLLNCLETESSAIAAFQEILDQEANALSVGNFEQLSSLTHAKLLAARKIAACSQDRETEQIALGFGPGHDGVDAACSSAKTGILKAAWMKLIDLAKSAREANYCNGVMIHTHLDFTRMSIEFFKPQGPALYGPNGDHTTGYTGGNHLAAG